jgi:uncharacterized protein YcbX
VQGARVTQLYVYPIKACGGVALSESDVVERGMAFDRRYMVVDRNGAFVTQRELAELCLVRTSLDADSIRVTARGRPELVLPLDLSRGEEQPYQVWGHSGHGLRSEHGSLWFSELLGQEVALVYMPSDERRPVNPKRARPGDIVSFADGYPLLLISEESLADLNQRLEAPLPMSRFRPNLVVSGCSPYAEDELATLTIGGIALRAVKRCERCVVTTIDQDSAEAGREPLMTLARYRKQDGKVWFGMNLIHDGCGTLRVGDLVSVP